MKAIPQADFIDPVPKIAGRVGLLFARSDEVSVRNLTGDESSRADKRAVVLVTMQSPDQSDQRRVVGQSEFIANPQLCDGVGTQFAQIESVRDDFQLLRCVTDSQMRSRAASAQSTIRSGTSPDNCPPSHADQRIARESIFGSSVLWRMFQATGTSRRASFAATPPKRLPRYIQPCTTSG